MLTFEYPQYLFLLLLVPLYFVLKRFLKLKGGELTFSFNSASCQIVRKGRGFINILTVVLDCAGFSIIVLLMLVLAGPVMSTRKTVYLEKGIDIMIVLDESPTMSARDFPPVNRFETARDVINRFISNRLNDAIGLVTFAKDAVLRVPPTTDHEFLREKLKNLRIMDLGNGTAIGMGIAIAVLHLNTESDTNKVIILLTDGQNNAGEILPRKAADIARKMKIKIYTIGVGTEGDIPYVLLNPETKTEMKGVISDSFDEDLLEDLAEATNGVYFHASNSSVLQTGFRAIDSFETIEKHTKVVTQTKSIHKELLMAVFIIGLLYLFLRKGVLAELV